ncbi:hypothetical protein [Kitasatospora sp. MBT66]|uniref:hypothetical protein n=1 Tax=Kitasatospora sp. MBT66 TaxID=1444769 RepID=UPI0005BC0F3C|nr:hypothetical protein [Kitasatospora sp. MBT66]
MVTQIRYTIAYPGHAPRSVAVTVTSGTNGSLVDFQEYHGPDRVGPVEPSRPYTGTQHRVQAQLAFRRWTRGEFLRIGHLLGLGLERADIEFPDGLPTIAGMDANDWIDAASRPSPAGTRPHPRLVAPVSVCRVSDPDSG